jgi:hypothetical protein
MNDQQDELLVRLIRIESKLSALMEALGYNTYGRPIANPAERQPKDNAPRDPFARPKILQPTPARQYRN